MKKDHRYPIIAVLALAQMVLSGTYLMAKLGLRDFSPLALGFYRFLITSVVLTGMLMARGWAKPPQPKDRWLFLLLSFLVVPLNQGLFLYGMKFTLASHGALFYATTPLVVFMLSCLFLDERPSWLKILGLALGFAGVLTVLLEKGLVLSSSTLRGDLLLILAVLSWAAYTILSKKAVAVYPPLYVTALSLTWGFLLFLPLGIPAALSQDYALISRNGILALLYLSLLTSVLGYLAWNWGLSQLDASQVTVLSNLQPLIAALLAWIFLGEAVTWRFVWGAAAVVAGVALTERG